MNIFDMVRRAKEAQEIMKNIRVTGKAGGDMVVITVNGNYEVEDIHIDSEVVAKNNAALIGDLVKAAFYDATTKLKREIQSQMGSVLPGGELFKGLLGGDQ